MNKTKELSPWERTCMRRIQKLIDEYCDGSQQRFAEKTGLNKGSVSQYVNGKNVPSMANVEKISAAFGVDVDWILAYDAIPPGIEESHKIDEYQFTQEAIELYERIQNLPQDKQIALQKYLQFLQSES